MTTPEFPGAGSPQSPLDQSQAPQAPQAPQFAPQNGGAPVHQGYAPTPQGFQPGQMPGKKALNVVGLIALIAAVVGFIFACVPGAFIVGWILLPIAFLLALASLFFKGKSKWMGLTALILAIIGTVVGFIVFFAFAATSLDDAISDGDTTAVQPPANDGAAEEEVPEAETDPSAPEGTRESPFPIGTIIENDEWRVVINSVTLAATDAVVGANQFNSPPADGSEYILVNYSVTYLGDDPNGQSPIFTSIDYVTPEGTTISAYDVFVVGPEPFDSTSTLYNGATATGNIVLQVPSATASQGVLAVQPSLLGDKVFVAVQ